MLDSEQLQLSWVAHWQQVLNDEDQQEPWNSTDCVYGVLADLRRNPHLFAEAFKPFPHADGLVSRLNKVVAWANEPPSPGLYMVPQEPLAATDAELVALAKTFVERVGQLDPEVSINSYRVIRSTSRSETLAKGRDALAEAEAEHKEFDHLGIVQDTAVDEAVEGKWPDDVETAYYFLSDPLYGLACDFYVEEYVRWALVEPYVNCEDPTEPLIQLWRCDAAGYVYDEGEIQIFATKAG